MTTHIDIFIRREGDLDLGLRLGDRVLRAGQLRVEQRLLLGRDHLLPIDDAVDEVDRRAVGREGQQDAAVHGVVAAGADEFRLEAEGWPPGVPGAAVLGVAVPMATAVADVAAARREGLRLRSRFPAERT